MPLKEYMPSQWTWTLPRRCCQVPLPSCSTDGSLLLHWLAAEVACKFTVCFAAWQVIKHAWSTTTLLKAWHEVWSFKNAQICAQVFTMLYLHRKPSEHMDVSLPPKTTYIFDSQALASQYKRCFKKLAIFYLHASSCLECRQCISQRLTVMLFHLLLLCLHCLWEQGQHVTEMVSIWRCAHNTPHISAKW